MDVSLQHFIQQKLRDHFVEVGDVRIASVGGGSINQTYRIHFAGGDVFCKVNSATSFPNLFIREKAGLSVLRKQGIIAIPKVLDRFEFEGHQILLLEWIKEGERTDNFWKKFGQQLATLHQVTDNAFGFSEDNYMGSVPQSNSRHPSWEEFFVAERLQPMIKRCAGKKLLTASHLLGFEKLITKLPGIFEPERPSLLHGDLWSGNFMCNHLSEPVLIDPAVCFGHRSMDLAMTTLFGGFRQPFYEAYNHHFPLPENYREQWAVCNLYPLLVHLYLFGGGYLPQIEATLKQFN